MKGEKMVRKISLAEFKNNVLLFPYLKKEDKTSEQFNFALDEIEKQNSIYIGKEKIILTKEGYIKGYEVIEDGVKSTLRVTLKYGADKNEKVITGLKRISKPGLRVFAGTEELPKVLGGLGIAIISTSKGLMTDKEARKAGVGGEVVAFIW